MADRVVIVDVSRGNEDLRPRDIKQMFGRAGRVHGKKEYADVHVILSNQKTDEWREKIANESSYEVRSNLHDLKSLVFHAVAQVVRKTVVDESSFYSWYDKTLDAFQRKNREETLPDFRKVAKELHDTGTAFYDEKLNTISPLPLGRVCASYYFSPYDVRDWFVNIMTLSEKRLTNEDVCQEWLLTNIDSNVSWERKDIKELMEVTLDTITGYNLRLKPGVSSCLLAVKHILNGTKPHVELPEYAGLRGDIGRVLSAIRAIVNCSKKVIGNQNKLVDVLELRAKYGVPTRLVNLVSLPGVGKTTAKELFEQFDVSNKEEILKRLEMIRSEASSGVKRAITTFLREEKDKAEDVGKTSTDEKTSIGTETL